MKRHPLPLAAAVAAATSFAHPSPTSASLLLALDAPALVDRADTIAVVDVMAARADWDEAHERILSTFELAVVESWKGTMAPAARVTVVQPGGTVGDITMVVSGMPRFTPGERALVFLRGPSTRAAVVGMTQGKRLLGRDRASGRWMVAPPDRAGASFVAPPRAVTPAVSALETRLRPLDDVRAELRALMTKGGAR